MTSYRDLLIQHLDFVNTRNYKRPIVGFDVETEGFGGPITHLGHAYPNQLVVTERMIHTDVVQTDPQPILALHGGKYDLRALKRDGLDWPKAIYADTMAAIWMLNEDLYRYGLKEVVPDYLPWVTEEKHFSEWLEGWREDMTQEEMRDYLEKDVRYTRALLLYAWPRLEEQDLLNVFLKVESPQMFLMAEMEERGIRIDRTVLEDRYNKNRANMAVMRHELKKMLPEGTWDCERCGGTGEYKWKRGDKTSPCTACGGEGYGGLLESSKQMADLVYGKFGLEPEDYFRTDGGQPSASQKALESILPTVEDERVRRFINLYIKYSKCCTLDSTFYGPYLEAGWKRAHPNWKAWGPVTGRYACSEPNLMNQPPETRNIFIPDEGYSFVDADYSQLEFYLLGHMAGETSITEAYENGGDIHQRTADIAGIDRDPAKHTNFGIVYGLSTRGLARRLSVSEAVAQGIKDSVLGGLPAVDDWMQRQKSEGGEKGYVTTILGRRRRLPSLGPLSHRQWNTLSKDERYRLGSERRKAVNAPIQGSAADLVKVAQIKLRMDVGEIEPLMQVHDQIVGQVPTFMAKEASMAMKESMETALPRLKPRVEVKVLDRWEK